MIPAFRILAVAALGAAVPLLSVCSPPGSHETEPSGADTTPAMEHVLTAQTYIWAPYDSVWSHLTRADAFEAWHSAAGLQFGGAPGDSVTWGSQDGVLYRGVLNSLEHGTGLSHTFSFTFLSDHEESVVTWDVVEQGEVVWVRVRHDCSQAPETAGVITEVGWTKSLERLKTLLETGTAMPWPTDPAE